MSKLLLAFLIVLCSLPAGAEDEVLARIFAQQGSNGTMVISSLRTGRTFIHNDLRARQRFPVASTFKILNTLISVQEKAISGKDGLLQWNGQMHDFPDWNHDQTLASAFRVSCVWCFQELARRVGAEKYRDYLRELEFGELREPFEETTFWLDGSLRISAIEQVDFLRRVYLPGPCHSDDILMSSSLMNGKESNNHCVVWPSCHLLGILVHSGFFGARNDGGEWSNSDVLPEGNR